MTESPASATPPTPVADESGGRDGRPFVFAGRPFVFAGFCFIALSFALSWWGLTRYRVPELRGIDLGNAAQMHEVEGKKESEDEAEFQKRSKEYRDQQSLYQRSWEVNRAQYGDFYLAQLGESYLGDLNFQDQRSLKSGTVYFRGWSTWTGWFGVLGIAVWFGWQIAPKFAPQIEPWSWAVPWAGAAWFGVFTLSAAAFFFTVPDENGPGYSQGVGFGNYLAIAGGALAVTGCVFLGLQTADQRVAFLQSRAAAADEEDDDDDDEPEPPKPVKNRLQDW